MRLEISITEKDVQEMLQRIQTRLGGDKELLMRAIGETAVTSINKNFERGGRPHRWKPSHRVEKKGGETLVNNAHLKKSIHPEATNDSVVIGTADVRAATLHFGAKQGSFGVFESRIKEHFRRSESGEIKKVKAHTRRQALPWGDIPPRPFMLVQDEDWEEIRNTIIEYIMNPGK